MKTKTEFKEKTWTGLITSKKISYIGNLKHYTISFKTGDIHVITENPIGVCEGDIISFNCSVHGFYFLASNIKIVGKKRKQEKKTRMQMTAERVKGY